MKKVKSIVILAAMATLMSAAGAYANQTDNATMSTQSYFTQTNSAATQGGFTTNLASLVTAGTITQAQADAIQSALEAAKPTGDSGNAGDQNRGKGRFTSVLDSLVTAGTITQAEEDGIQAALKAAKPEDSATALDALVTAGTITQSQEDAIKTALEAAKPAGDTGKGEERNGGKGGLTSVLDSLVTAGTITQAQADAVRSSFHK